MRKKGFTLIELLVVIAIIGLLSTVVMVSLNSARKKARDARRKADINQIVKALMLYYDKYGVYPSETYCDSSIGSCGAPGCPCSGTDWDYATAGYIGTVLRSEGIMNNLPKDPINNSVYFYYYEPSCNDGPCAGRGCCYYFLMGYLEGGGTYTVSSY